MNRDSFIFYRSFYEAISGLNKKDKATILLAVCDYALNGVEKELSGVPAAMFSLMKPNLDANQKKYENGSKGGRPKSKTKPNDNLNETKLEPNHNPMNNELCIMSNELCVMSNEDENADGKGGVAPASFSELIQGYQFSQALDAKVSEWMDYKREKRQPYKPTGLKALLSEIQNNANRHGEQAVISLISECMAANWQGIIFERLERFGSGGTQKKSNNAHPSMQYDADKLKAEMDRMDRLLARVGNGG